jgi:hypothetical protein
MSVDRNHNRDRNRNRDTPTPESGPPGDGAPESGG